MGAHKEENREQSSEEKHRFFHICFLFLFLFPASMRRVCVFAVYRYSSFFFIRETCNVHSQEFSSSVSLELCDFIISKAYVWHPGSRSQLSPTVAVYRILFK